MQKHSDQAARRDEIKVDPENLFDSYPVGTLALMGAGSGVIAVVTLLMELMTSQVHATAAGFPVPFVSMPMAVATMVLAGLIAKHNRRYAMPALILGSAYWLAYAGWWIAS